MGIPAITIGRGMGGRSHALDEWIDVSAERNAGRPGGPGHDHGRGVGWVTWLWAPGFATDITGGRARRPRLTPASIPERAVATDPLV